MSKYSLIQYSNTHIKGFESRPIIIESSFAPKLDWINEKAKAYGFMVWVTNSTRIGEVKLTGTVVTPAKMSNHKVGHAIDFNLQDITTKEWFNNAKLSDNAGKDLKFLIEIDLHSELRWGGRFSQRDAIHIDDGLNIINPKKYLEIYKAIQK